MQSTWRSGPVALACMGEFGVFVQGGGGLGVVWAGVAATAGVTQPDGHRPHGMPEALQRRKTHTRAAKHNA